MLYLDLPSPLEFKTLHQTRAEACISIYLDTTPLTQNIEACRIELGNLAKQAYQQLEAVQFDKRQLAAIAEYIDELIDDDEFWRFQAHGLAVLVTPSGLRTFRLASSLSSMVEVSDRFYLTPLLRAITFSNSAFILALSENAVRLLEVHEDAPAVEVNVANLPKDAASAVGKSTLNDRSPSGRIQGLEGQNVRYHQYVRQVDSALRSVLKGQEAPLILAATGRLEAVFRSLNSYPHLLAQGIVSSPDRLSVAELGEQVREILTNFRQEQLNALKAQYKAREGEQLVTTDLAIAARAATYGAIETLIVNIDNTVPGTVDEQTGDITFAEQAGATTYGIVDEIAGRAFMSGARVFGVTDTELAEYGEIVAILRYPI